MDQEAKYWRDKWLEAVRALEAELQVRRIVKEKKKYGKPRSK